jgi:enolase-phosphatase E1
MTVLAFAAESALLDIEGTISPQTYVRDVLFPYSRARLAEFVREREGAFEVASILEDARRESGRDDAVAALLDWQDRDVKATPLKALQGLIWERGYAAGDFASPIYPDALAALRRWRDSGVRLYVYSSGSVKAQDLFFRYSASGDLRLLFSGFFDTTSGPKTESSSYRRIANQIGAPPADIVFFSDSVGELAAAEGAGLQVAHVVKDGAARDLRWRPVDDFADVDFAPRAPR